jgi:hypothetical protein
MPKDPTVQVAVVGVLTTLITTLGVIIVAVLNNKKERGDAADEGIAGTLRERITLRDEQILELREEKADLRVQLDKALVENEEKTTLIRHLREELAAKEDEA